MAKKKIFWAMDPYAENKESWSDVLEVLKGINVTDWGEVTPTYLLGHQLVHWIANITPSQVSKLKPVANEVMEASLKEVDFPNLNSHRIVISEGLTQREDLQVFAEDLKKEKVDLVVINTHARGGIERLFLGSFTENLLLKTEVPVLIVPPGARMDGAFNKCLIPTSFSDHEKSFFTEFVKGSHGFKSDVFLYSKVFHPIDAFAQSASYTLGGGWVSLESYTEDEIARRNSIAEEWVAIGKENGVNVEFAVDETPGEFADRIGDKVAATKSDMVVMPSYASANEAIYLGSNARELIRSSKVPVMVQHLRV